MGASSLTTPRSGSARASATASVRAMASVLGNTWTKTSITAVIPADAFTATLAPVRPISTPTTTR